MYRKTLLDPKVHLLVSAIGKTVTGTVISLYEDDLLVTYRSLIHCGLHTDVPKFRHEKDKLLVGGGGHLVSDTLYLPTGGHFISDIPTYISQHFIRISQ
jgi:hypothetical protein